MFQQKLNSFDELPVRDNDRKCTDVVCTFIGGLFALVLFIISLVMFNKENYYKTNFPTDSDNKPCAYAENQQYAFIYFPNVNDPETRVCVSSCPQSSDLQTECRTNSKVSDCASVNIYQSSQNLQRLGGFCLPDDQAARDKLVNNANLGEKWRFLNTYDIIRLSLIFALCIGIIWMIMVQCCPRFMGTAAIALGSAILLVSGILLLVDNPTGWQGKQVWRIIIGVILIIFSLVFLTMLCLYRRRLKVSSIFLEYATRFLGQKPINFVFIPIFLLLTLGLICLCLFQYLALSSNGEPVKTQDDIYLHSVGNNFLTALVVIQFIWGMQFLKDTFNFFVSGNATQWYVNEGRESNCCIPVSRFFKYNFGSVAGGSFLNAFFNFIDFLFETLRCYPDGCCGMCAPCSNLFSRCCGCFFDLVRNDAYSYINLTGIPYCNAARNCEVLCNSSRLFVGSQSVLFFYRLCAHTFCVGLTVLISYALMKGKISGINTWSLVLIILLSYCIVTYFIDIHADAAEGLQISYLLDNDLNGPKQRVPQLQDLNNQLQNLTRGDEDGKCSAD